MIGNFSYLHFYKTVLPNLPNLLPPSRPADYKISTFVNLIKNSISTLLHPALLLPSTLPALLLLLTVMLVVRVTGSDCLDN